MTSLLIGTFVISGIHTLLWLPRAFEMRRALKVKKPAPEPPSMEKPVDDSKNDTRKS
jgi:hypothetical protein